jgi:hypothetical protein
MTPTKKAAIVSIPRNALLDLLSRPGGKSRDQAIAEAENEVETLRATSLDAIELAIASIEATARGQMSQQLSDDELERVLAEADVIVGLAQIFGLAHLDAASRSMCDLASALIAAGRRDAQPVRVHVRALRLFAPRSTPLSDDEVKLVLAELARFRAHFGVRPLHAAAEAE